MKNFFECIRLSDYSILFIFALYNYTIWNDQINGSTGAINLMISTSIVTYMYFNRVINKKGDALQIIIVLLLLFINYIVNECGLGAILGFWEFYLLLCLCKYLRISKETFLSLFYLVGIIIIAYAYRIYTNPTILISALGGDTNGNMVGIFMYDMVACVIMFYPKGTFFNKFIIGISIFLAAVTIWISGCRSAQLAFCLLSIMKIYSIVAKGAHFYFFKRFLYRGMCILLFAGIIFVLLSIGGNSGLIESIIGSVSDQLGNEKGATLSERGTIWAEAMDAFIQTPILGTGSKLRISSYSDEALALHSSTMNILVVYGLVLYLMTMMKIKSYFKILCRYSIYDDRIFLGIISYAGILIISCFESNLMDYFKFYSMIPILYTFSILNQDYNITR